MINQTLWKRISDLVSFQLTDHDSLIMDKDCEVFEDFVHIAYLLLDLLDSLFPLLNNGIIEDNLIVQEENLSPSKNKNEFQN